MTTITKHRTTCRRVFNRYDAACPRCQELAQGQPARAGWGDFKRLMEAQEAAAVTAHLASERHRTGGCGPVCTFGDW